jgi:hypothetical protein
MTQSPTFDPSIPVLTEVFKDQPVKKEAPEDTVMAPPEAVAPVGAEAVGPEAPEPVETEQTEDAVEVAPPDAETAASATSDAELEARAVDSWTEPEWTLLERRLSERILHQLQDRVDFVLEQRLRDSMAEALQHAMAGLTSEIRESLQQTIETIVVRAVAQELAHLQTLKK